MISGIETSGQEPEFARATAELKASGIEGRALKIGDRAPDFILFNQGQVEVSSKDLLQRGPMVVSFFRGHW